MENLNTKHIDILNLTIEVLDNKTEELTPYLLQEIADSSDMVELNIVNSHGIITVSNVPEFQGLNFNDYEATRIYMNLIDGSMDKILEEPRLSVVAGSENNIMSHFVGLPHQSQGGFVQAGFNANIISELTDQICIDTVIREKVIGRSGYGFVIRDGEIYAHPSDLLVGRDVTNEPWFTAVSTDSGYERASFFGEDYFAKYLNHNEYTIVGLIPEYDFYSVLDHAMFDNLLGLLITIVIAFIVIHLTLKGFFAPVNELVGKIGDISQGQYDVRIESDCNFEFEQIKEAVNSMAEEIEERDGKMKDALVQLKQSNEAKSRFLANMSHEMHTPLNAIIGMSTVGERTKDEGELRHSASETKKYAQQLLGMVNDVLDMGKSESGQLELYNSTFAIRDAVEKVVAMIQLRTDEKKQTLRVEIDKEVPEEVIGDENKLSQILMALLDNASKFTQESGLVELYLKVLDASKESCRIRFTISDTGIGISESNHEDIFEYFFQAVMTSDRRYGGIGMGLALADSLVTLMGGNIEVESEEGKGATFTFEIVFPLSPPITATESSDTDAQRSNARDIEDILYIDHTILLADDVAINRDILQMLLEPTQITIDFAINGAEAVTMFASSPEKYDLIFMDIQMPEMDGYEATRTIRALDIPKAKTIPIVAISANTFQDDIDKCYESGMNGHIGKPVDIDSLLNELQKYLD
jgi:signal transduction histidine kinase/CheY-like chemotaxis protein